VKIISFFSEVSWKLLDLLSLKIRKLAANSNLTFLENIRFLAFLGRNELTFLRKFLSFLGFLPEKWAKTSKISLFWAILGCF